MPNPIRYGGTTSGVKLSYQFNITKVVGRYPCALTRQLTPEALTGRGHAVAQRKWFRATGICLCLTFLLLSYGHITEAAALKNGATGGSVFDLQSRLAALGYGVGDVDGVFGGNTAAALELFQQDHGLMPDGIAGEQTLKTLESTTSQVPSVSRGLSSRDLAFKIVQTSKRYIGVPYVFGGDKPSGFDCSGFVQYVLAKEGIMEPRTADLQYGIGMAVSNSDLQPGDLVFFSTYLPGPSHVGIYIGQEQFINAQSSKGVAIANLSTRYWATRYIGAKRILR
jgi:peptidoglycan DL-endopeptidase CwlO